MHALRAADHVPAGLRQDHQHRLATRLQGSAGLAHYCAAKAAIIAFTRSLSHEISTSNITANCVAPGATQTRMVEGLDKDLMESLIASIPKRRLATIDEIVLAYVFLASDEARHFVGQCLSPNGGDVML